MVEATTIINPAASPAPAASSSVAAAPSPATAAVPAGVAPTPAPAGTSAESPNPTPGDWRSVLAGEDEKSKQMLERYADPATFMKSFTEAQTLIRSKMDGAIKIPGADATDEDRAAFAKALGVPDAPDKYDMVKPPEGLDLGEGDTAFIKAKLADLHKQGGFAAHPEVAKTFQALYYEALTERASQMAAAAVVRAQETERALQKEYGPDYKINIGIAGEALRSLGGEAAVDMLGMQLADGTRLGDHAGFVKLMVNAGRATSEDINFTKSLVSAPAMGVEALQAEYDKMRAWRNGTPAEKARYAQISGPGGELEKTMAMLERASGRRA